MRYDATHGGIANDVNIIALKVLGASGSGSFGAVEDALQWVIANQATYNIVAVNMSLGAGNYTTNPYTFMEDEFST
ncbi:MAG: S8 family serine peptidase [Planctomycetaceae bacterium]